MEHVLHIGIISFHGLKLILPWRQPDVGSRQCAKIAKAGREEARLETQDLIQGPDIVRNRGVWAFQHFEHVVVITGASLPHAASAVIFGVQDRRLFPESPADAENPYGNFKTLSVFFAFEVLEFRDVRENGLLLNRLLMGKGSELKLHGPFHVNRRACGGKWPQGALRIMEFDHRRLSPSVHFERKETSCFRLAQTVPHRILEKGRQPLFATLHAPFLNPVETFSNLVLADSPLQRLVQP